MKEKQNIDYTFFFATLLLIGLGLIMVFSTTNVISNLKYQDHLFLFKKQAIFALAGILIMILFSGFDYFKLKKIAYPFLIISTFLLLILVLTGGGKRVGGASRWLNLGIFQLQPSEFIKIGIIIFVAYFIDKKSEYIKDIKLFLGPLLLIITPILCLILFQPDFGMFAVICLTIFLLLFIAGFPVIYGLGVLLVTYPLFYLLIVRVPYRMKRITAFLDPWSDPLNKGFQIIQSYIGFYSGGFSGVGFGFGKQKLMFLPEAHTDFILSVIGEEFGFLGILFLILLFSYALFKGYYIAFKSRELFGKLLGFGLITVLALQIITNTFVVMGLFPTKGITLPFISYGGSSMLSCCIISGILLNISKNRREV